MGLLKDFKEFAMRGNVVDMAVGVVVGAAFSKITSSLVDNIIMPPLGVLMGGVDFSNLFINLSDVPVKTLAEASTGGQCTGYCLWLIFKCGHRFSDYRIFRIYRNAPD